MILVSYSNGCVLCSCHSRFLLDTHPSVPPHCASWNKISTFFHSLLYASSSCLWVSVSSSTVLGSVGGSTRPWLGFLTIPPFPLLLWTSVHILVLLSTVQPPPPTDPLRIPVLCSDPVELTGFYQDPHNALPLSKHDIWGWLNIHLNQCVDIIRTEPPGMEPSTRSCGQ